MASSQPATETSLAAVSASRAERPTPSAGPPSRSPAATTSSYGTFVNPGALWATGLATDGVVLYSTATGSVVQALAIGAENLLIEPVAHAQVADWVYFVQTSAPFPQLTPVGPRLFMRVTRGGGKPQLVARLTDTSCSITACFALSDDGTRLAYRASDLPGAGPTSIVKVRNLRGGTQVLQSMPGALRPVGWLPDGHTLVLAVATEIDEIDVDVQAATAQPVLKISGAAAACQNSLAVTVADDGTIMAVEYACTPTLDMPPPNQRRPPILGRVAHGQLVDQVTLTGYAGWDVQTLAAPSSPPGGVILVLANPIGGTCAGPDIERVTGTTATTLATPPGC